MRHSYHDPVVVLIPRSVRASPRIPQVCAREINGLRFGVAWKKGQTGNAGGRPRAIAGNAARLSRLIEEASDGGKAIVDELMTMFRQPAHTPAAEARKLRIAEILLERFAGRPQVEVSVDAVVGVGPTLPLGALRPQDLDALEIALAPVVAEIINADDPEPRALPDPDATRAP